MPLRSGREEEEEVEACAAGPACPRQHPRGRHWERRGNGGVRGCVLHALRVPPYGRALLRGACPAPRRAAVLWQVVEAAARAGGSLSFSDAEVGEFLQGGAGVSICSASFLALFARCRLCLAQSRN